MTGPDTRTTREQRLAERLRENLRRRKQQARALQEDPPGKAPDDAPAHASPLSKPDSSR